MYTLVNLSKDHQAKVAKLSAKFKANTGVDLAPQQLMILLFNALDHLQATTGQYYVTPTQKGATEARLKSKPLQGIKTHPLTKEAESGLSE